MTRDRAPALSDASRRAWISGMTSPTISFSQLRLLMSVLGTVLPSCAQEVERVEVRIIAPAAGDTVVGDVEVKLSATGIEIAPASDHRPGTAHHHLFVNRDVTPAGEKMPAGTTGLIHLGKGDSTFTIRDLGSGEHRVIAVLGDSAHVPLEPFVADTILWVVRSKVEIP